MSGVAAYLSTFLRTKCLELIDLDSLKLYNDAKNPNSTYKVLSGW